MSKISFHALVLEITDRCTAKCGMCYQAAGPKGSDIRGDGHLSPEDVRSVIAQGADLAELNGQRVHVSGGEGFIYFNQMVGHFKVARDCGYRHIGSTTNSFWAINRRIAAERCTVLAEAGVTYLEVSYDFWHLPYVSVDRIRNLVHAARDTGIRVMLRTLTTKSHHLPELLEPFTDDELLHVHVANSTVAPVGRAKDEVPFDDVYTSEDLTGCCETLLNLTVTPNGNVYPCCAGSDITNALAVGNVKSHSLADIVMRLRTDYMLRVLIHQGPLKIKGLVEKLGLGDRLQPEHSSICHLCWDIFRDDDLAARLRSAMEDEQLAFLIAQLSDSQVAAGQA